MPPVEATLFYHSKMGGALAPGEHVRWEDRPHFPARRKQPLRRIVALTSVPLAVMILTAIATRGDRFIMIVVTFVAGGLTTLGVVLSEKADPRRRFPLLAHAVYRITNQRIIRMDDRPGKPFQQSPIEKLRSFSTVHGRHPRISMGVTLSYEGVTFERVADVNDVVLRVLDLWAKSGRRWKERRMGSMAEIAPQTAVPGATQQLPREIVLMEGERVLWIGQPRVRDPMSLKWWMDQLLPVGWLCVPAVALMSWWGKFPYWLPRAPDWMALIALVWIAVATYAMTLGRWKQRRRRARTTFVLTNVRAIIHIGGRAPSAQSNLLDMVNHLNLTPLGDGAADVAIGAAVMGRLQYTDAVTLHAAALDAVRIAGTPAGGIIKPAEVLEEP